MTEIPLPCGVTRREAAAGASAVFALAFAGEAHARPGELTAPPAGFSRRDWTFDVALDGPGKRKTPVRKTVLVSDNDGPAVIVMHEVFGFTSEVLTFCRVLVASGFRVYAPVLFGPAEVTDLGMGQFARLCISREIHVFAADRTSPIVDWLKGLAVAASAETSAWGKGAGVIGLCLTGDFAMAMAVEPKVLAPVMGEPSLPFRLVGGKDDLHISPGDLRKIRDRHRDEGLIVKGHRFVGDKISPVQKFDRLKRELGPAFERGLASRGHRDIPDGEGKDGHHSVFTLHHNEDSAWMREVMADLKAFLHQRLDLA